MIGCIANTWREVAIFFVEVVDKKTGEILWKATHKNVKESAKTADLVQQVLDKNGNCKKYFVRTFRSVERTADNRAAGYILGPVALLQFSRDVFSVRFIILLSGSVATTKRKVNTMKKMILIAVALLVVCTLAGCSSDADVASRNLSKAADMFEIERRVVFYNGITGGYLLSLEGRCSINDQGRQLEVTCKTGPSSFKKHFLGLSDNVTYFSEQVDSADVSVYHYRVIFKPESIVPNIDLETSI